MNPIAKKRFEKFLAGYAIIHGIIYSKERIAFITKDVGGVKGYLKNQRELEARFILYNPNYNQEKKGVSIIGWPQGINRAWASFSGGEEYPIIISSDDSYLREYRSDSRIADSTEWELLAPPKNTDTAMLRGITGCKNICGEVYMFGRFRKLYQRIGQQKWKDLTYEDTHPNLHRDLELHKKNGGHLRDLGIGFLDIDGFSGDDIYGCGDSGDLWHYDGKSWQRLDPPVNAQFTSILCAKDGYVYIGQYLGGILKGRLDNNSGESWEVIKLDNGDTNSLAWFQGKVYIGSESGLFTIDPDTNLVEKYEFPEDGYHQYSFQNVSSCDEALLSYGIDQALVFDGESWEEIGGNIVVVS